VTLTPTRTNQPIQTVNDWRSVLERYCDEPHLAYNPRPGEHMEKTKAAPAPELPLCFVISPIGAEGSDVRNTADKVLKHVITKALSGRYKIQRADEIAMPGLITTQVVQRLMDAPLVIADLSDRNANVYYELAIRHAHAKPVIHIIADGQDAPFDVKDLRLISYDLKEPDSLDKAQEKIQEQASEIAKGHKVITVIQVAQILAKPATSDDAGLPQLLRAIYNALASLQQEVRETKQVVTSLEPTRVPYVDWEELRRQFLAGTQVPALSDAQSAQLPGKVEAYLRDKAKRNRKARSVDASFAGLPSDPPRDKKT
jgi:hypothetical protein